MRYVIVGNGPAGTAAVEGIREADPKGRITVISDEGVVNYSKPLLSYLLARKVKRNQLAHRPEDFYARNGVDLLLKKKAVELETAENRVLLSDGKSVPYERLLIATGGVPIPLRVPGKKMGGIFSFTRLQEAEDLARYLKDQSVREAVVVGGGLIGLKATEGLLGRGISVTLVELADRVLSATFDRRASEIIEGALKKEGCQVFLKNTVTRIGGDRSGKVKEVILQGRVKVPCQVIIGAIGVLPNLDWVKGTEIRSDRGILVDEHLKTSVGNVFAAGDCCQTRDFFGGAPRVVPIWPSAVRQGKVAGFNMAGGKKEYEGPLVMNSVELCGIPTISVGLTDPSEGNGYETLESLHEKKGTYKKLVLRDDRIVGALFVGDISRAGVYTGLIREAMKIGDLKDHLLKESFGLIHLPRDYRKHHVTGEGIEV
jgi:NAD(P)H-nitrite reductase large subunit